MTRPVRLYTAAGLFAGSIATAALGAWYVIGARVAAFLASTGAATLLLIASVLVATDPGAHAAIGRAVLRRIGGGS